MSAAEVNAAVIAALLARDWARLDELVPRSEPLVAPDCDEIHDVGRVE